MPALTCVVPADQADRALEVFHDNGEDAYVIGQIEKGEEKVVLV